MTTFDPPGSQYTEPRGIDTAGAIKGDYGDAGRVHGFLRPPNGTFTKFDPPGSTFTQPTGISPAGAITGYYYYHTVQRGVVRAPGGTFTSFAPPPGSTRAIRHQLGGGDHGILPRRKQRISRLPLEPLT